MVAAGREARCTPRSTRARDGGEALARFDGRAAPTVNARGTRALWAAVGAPAFVQTAPPKQRSRLVGEIARDKDRLTRLEGRKNKKAQEYVSDAQTRGKSDDTQTHMDTWLDGGERRENASASCRTVAERPHVFPVAWAARYFLCRCSADVPVLSVRLSASTPPPPPAAAHRAPHLRRERDEVEPASQEPGTGPLL